MKTQRLFQWMLMPAVAMGLSLTSASCTDDDDAGQDAGEVQVIDGDPYAKTGAAATALLGVVSQLADVDSLPDNWREATFEPTEGRVLDASSPYVRSVAVVNMTEARDLFRAYCGENFDATAPSATWTQEGVGSMTFHALNQSDCLATIDVSLPQMPHLTQLRLVPVAALGNNALKYEAYYRIGDVVKDKDGAYWICVRSAGGPKEKTKTHWVSMQLLENDSPVSGFKSNVKTVSSGGNSYDVPQNLGGTEVEHLKYFAQLMYLLQRPEEYAQNMGEGQALEGGLGALGTDAQADATAISAEFLRKTAKMWNDYDLWKKVLPPHVTKDYFLEPQVNILYNGHSNALLGSGVNLFLCTQSGTCLSEQTLTKPAWTKSTGDQTFNIREYASNGAAVNSNIPGLERAIVVRMCTGKELADNLLMQPDYDERITNVANNFLTKYRMEGYSPYYHPGDVFKDQNGHRWFVVYPAGAMVDDNQSNTPYAYLMSLEGITASDNKRYATNLPNERLARQVFTMMAMTSWEFAGDRNKAGRFDHDEVRNPNTGEGACKSVYDHAGVDLAYLYNVTYGGQFARDVINTGCFAFDDGSQGQKLMRFILDNRGVGAVLRFRLWTHYPAFPSEQYVDLDPTQFYQPDGVSTFKPRLMLEDMALDMSVSAYAKDYYAKLPLLDEELGGAQNLQPRQCRTETDLRARNVENYYYNRETFAARAMPLSMWNEPVVFFRATKVFDQGGDDYDKTTVDGLKLTAVYKLRYDAGVGSPYGVGTTASGYQYARTYNDSFYINDTPVTQFDWWND